jgi:hypothetical protein
MDKSFESVKFSNKNLKMSFNEEKLNKINEERVENDLSIHNISKTMEKDIAPKLK